MPTIYYLPGHGGRLDTGLGQELISRGWDLTGRATVGEFRNLSFSDQVDTINKDLKDHFWHSEARVVANSFGAYLFLHAQAQMDAFIGKVLLLSPIVGEFGNSETMMNFVPARSGVLQDLISNGKFNIPLNCELHVGSEDWQSNPDSVSKFSMLTGLKANIVPGAGHALPKEYVKLLLDEWL